MKLFPAIDLFGGQAVRLLKGDYQQMTVYNADPAQVALDFQQCGAEQMHLVDLEGARSGKPENLDSIRSIREATDLFMEVGGGIRSMETVERYFAAGVNRVILGTAAVTDASFLKEALRRYGDRIAVGVDIKDGYVAIRGWTEQSALRAEDFFGRMEAQGVRVIICTDISRDGAMRGVNRALYRKLIETYRIDLIASGGVSSLEDISVLREYGLHGAIIGKAYYIGAIDLKKAIEVAR